MADENAKLRAVDSEPKLGPNNTTISSSAKSRRSKTRRGGRGAPPRTEARPTEEPPSDVKYHGRPRSRSTSGLALSGGGIRSSAICLGVLQALNHHDLIKRIDYLSTVSGGGYIGSSLTATMTRAGEFRFRQSSAAGSGNAHAAEISDTPAVGHIRNYSNYLIPAGARDLLTGMAIVVRGLVANLSLTLPVVLFLAALTVLSNPARSSLYVPNFFGFRVGSGNYFHFSATSGARSDSHWPALQWPCWFSLAGSSITSCPTSTAATSSPISQAPRLSWG